MSTEAKDSLFLFIYLFIQQRRQFKGIAKESLVYSLDLLYTYNKLHLLYI